MKQPINSRLFFTRSLGVIFCWGLLLFVLIQFILLGNVAAKQANHNTLPLAAGICVNSAQALFQEGKHNEAIALLEEFKNKKKKGSNHYYIYFLLGNFYSALSSQKDYTGNNSSDTPALHAIDCYQASVTQNPSFNAGWLNLAKSLYESGFFARAAMAFEQGYTTSETPKPIHLYYVAVCHFQAGALQKALVEFERLNRVHPETIRLAWKETLVNILFSLERYVQALPILEELAAKTMGKQKKKWQEILLYQYLSLKMDKKALSYAEFLTRTDILEPKWWKALCHIHLKGNRLKKGVSALMIYGYLTPLTQKELMLAGDLYVSLDVPAKAEQLYQRAMQEDRRPKNILKISRAYSMAYDPKKALDWLELGLENGRDVQLLSLKAQILYSQKKFDRAAHTYENLPEALSANVSEKSGSLSLGNAWLMLGYALLNKGQTDAQGLARAQTVFLKAASFKPQEKSAQKALKHIKQLKIYAQQENSYVHLSTKE